MLKIAEHRFPQIVFEERTKLTYVFYRSLLGHFLVLPRLLVKRGVQYIQLFSRVSVSGELGIVS